MQRASGLNGRVPVWKPVVSAKQPLSPIQAHSNYKLVGQSFSFFVSALETLAQFYWETSFPLCLETLDRDSFNFNMLSFLSRTSRQPSNWDFPLRRHKLCLKTVTQALFLWFVWVALIVVSQVWPWSHAFDSSLYSSVLLTEWNIGLMCACGLIHL